MYKLFEIAKNNIKKQKGDMVTFFILTFIAAFLIFDGASAIIGLGRVMDEKFSEINGAHVMLINPDTEEEKKSAEKAFEENEHITDFEMTPAVMLNCEYKNKNDKDFMEFEFIAEDFNVKKTIMNVPRPGENFKKDDILLIYINDDIGIFFIERRSFIIKVIKRLPGLYSNASFCEVA